MGSQSLLIVDGHYDSDDRRDGKHNELEDDMDGPTEAMELFFHLMGGLGIFFLGVGVLWFVAVYKEINQKKE